MNAPHACPRALEMRRRLLCRKRAAAVGKAAWHCLAAIGLVVAIIATVEVLLG
jgi:hypothetical protein